MGFDPTSPDLHFGHLVALRKLRAFQEWGAHVYALIGDFTARIGDPSGRKKTRPGISEEEVSSNARTYQEQFFRILDPNKTHVVFNSSWLASLSLEKLLELASYIGVSKLLSRQDFQQRLQSEEPLGFHELHYPLLQAYDSFVLEADVEVGGQDQIFNLLLGRDIQRALGQHPQVVMTLPLLEGLDGRLKMSKSFGNVIALKDPPEEMFGKVMAISDELLKKYIRLLDPRPHSQVKAVLERLENASINPMEEKKGFALAMVSWIHGAEDARRALRFFEERFQKRQVPEALREEVITIEAPDIWIGDLLKRIGFVKSSSEFLRKAQEGAIQIDGVKLSDSSLRLTPRLDPLIIKLGKKMAKVRLEYQKLS